MRCRERAKSEKCQKSAIFIALGAISAKYFLANMW
jgi:hypothetical protein